MSHLRHLNQQAPPFWDWVTAMGGGAPEHNGVDGARAGPSDEKTAAGPSADGKPQHDADIDMAQTGYHAEVNPPEYDGEDPPTPPEAFPEDHFAPEDPPHGKLPDRSRGPPGEDSADGPHRCGPGRHGRGGPSGWHHGPHGHGSHPWFGRGRGGPRGGRSRGGFFGGPPPFGGPHGFGGGPFGGGFPFDMRSMGMGASDGATPPHMNGWAEMAKKFAERLGLDADQFHTPSGAPDATAADDGVDFTPAIDVYAAPAHYHVHVALPGAQKEDIGVTWDEGAQALTVAGVVTRGVDEALAAQLAVAERRVGVFRRVVTLGDAQHPARVDADAIAATMEAGVLKIVVGRVEAAEVKKVVIE